MTLQPSSKDCLQAFMFDDVDVRGAIITLEDSFQQFMQQQTYSAPLQGLLAQFIAANALLASQTKSEGLLSLQAKGNSLSLIVSECTHDLKFRAVAHGQMDNDDFVEALTGGTLAIMVQPKNGQTYQGIVPLEKNTLAGCLQDYFRQSQQLDSWFFLCEQGGKICGFMLQALPPQKCLDAGERDEHWSRLTHLAATIEPKEIAELEHHQLLYRLFNQEQLSIFEEQAVKFECSCSRERMERAILTINKEEIAVILREDGQLSTQCHFCNARYVYTAGEIQQLLQGGRA